jgi:hypothetical protein
LGPLYWAFLRKEVKSGIEAQCNFLREFCECKKFPYIKYNWKWAKVLRSSSLGKIPWECQSHICMNVQVLLAVACATAIKSARDQKLPVDTLAFPDHVGRIQPRQEEGAGRHREDI